MEQIVSENLFLLEFLVDKCIILPCAIPKEVQQVTGETCVSFKFLDNDPLDVCEEDFAPKRKYSDEENMKSGKSCLFAMSSTQAEEALTEFDIVVGIFKKLTNGMLPDKIQIGTAIIPVAATFTEIIQLVKANMIQQTQETVSRTLKDCFNIVNINDEVIGSISVFLRMSCFGKLIVTQFQMNLDDKSVFFKDKEGKSLYKYRKASKGEMKGDRKRPCKPMRPISARGDDTTMTDQMTTFDGRCADCVPTDAAVGTDFGETYSPANASMVPYASTLSEKGNYQEIGAEMNGNALTIRVHKNKGNVKRLDGDDTELINSTQNPCICDGGKNVTSLQSSPPCTCLAGDKQVSGSTGACYCLRPTYNSAPSGRSGFPCAEKQILSLKGADDPNNPFAFRVSGCPGGGGNQNVTVVSPTNTRPDGMQVTEISDPSKDVFILRIGKKSEGTDKKANLELELVTPKGIDKKPIPKKQTQETQWDDKDAGEAGGGGKGKRGSKGGKGGKGGKGKKGKGGGDDDEDGEGGEGGRSGRGDGKGGGGSRGGLGGSGSGDGSRSKRQRDKDKDKNSLPAYLNFQIMKADKNLPADDICGPCGPCSPPAYCWCVPPGWNKPILCCGTQQPCPPTYQTWQVPSNTNLQCSYGRITSVKAPCNCSY